MVFLDAPGKIAIIPDVQSSIDASMFAAFDQRSYAADFIAMLATAEAFKLLAGYAENPSRAINGLCGRPGQCRL